MVLTWLKVLRNSCTFPYLSLSFGELKQHWWPRQLIINVIVCWVKEVETSAFRDLPNLVTLILSHNRLSSLGARAFSGLTHLQKLELQAQSTNIILKFLLLIFLSVTKQMLGNWAEYAELTENCIAVCYHTVVWTLKLLDGNFSTTPSTTSRCPCSTTAAYTPPGSALYRTASLCIHIQYSPLFLNLSHNVLRHLLPAESGRAHRPPHIQLLGIGWQTDLVD